MKYKFVTLLLASSAILSISPVCAETIQESISQALATHPSVDVGQAGKFVAEEDRLEARSGLFPTVGTSLSAGRIFGDNSTSRGLSVNRGTAYSWLGEGSASLTQPIFDGMETFNRIDAAKAREMSADFNISDIRQNLSFQAVQAHLGVLQVQETLNKVQSYYKTIESYLERIELMVNEGVADESEAAQARNISLMLKSTVTDYEGQFLAAQARYREIVGNMPRSELVKPAIISNAVLDDVEQAVSYARLNHPLVKSGLENLKAAQYDIEAEKAGFYPNLDGELSYLKRDQEEEIGGELTDARAILKMSWDFETGGAQKARTRKTKAQYSELLAQNKENQITIEGDVRRAYAEYDTAKRQMELVRQRESVTQDLFSAYETQFEGARIRLLQLMQAENQLYTAQLEAITAEYRFISSQYAVLASMGQLLEQVNSPIVSLNLDSSKNLVTEEPPLIQASFGTEKLSKEIDY